MTYEQMMLSIFSRYRGQALDKELVSKIQSDCEREVWCHLPPGIQESWKLTLGIGEDGNLELRPQQLKKGIVGELESALASEFRERGRSHAAPLSEEKNPSPQPESSENEPRGGIAAVNVAFGSPDVPPVFRSKTGEGNNEDPSHVPSDAAVIESMAKELGISLPSNASLLGPFLEALTKAHEFKQRAEAAEAKVEQFTRLLQSQG